MTNLVIKDIIPLGFMWPVRNPFLFCAHHLDNYPAGNERMEPVESLQGRNIGNDFTIKDGWRMYHGDKIPGFPVHPHRGFETVTIVMEGFVDHSDSHGQAGRYGAGDVQWMTAGAGLQHSEMFPLLKTGERNPLELFQVWLNLPKSRKFADPHFKMLWREQIPQHKLTGKNGSSVTINIIAGELGGIKAPDPAPDSWAAFPENRVQIWTVKMEKGSDWILPVADEKDLPVAGENIVRSIYFYRGGSILVNGTEVKAGNAIDLFPGEEVVLESKDGDNLFLFLQGVPIDEPVAQYGPFVMNTQREITEAIRDYRETGFGGWPWPRNDNVHPRERGRFAIHKDGSEEIR